MKVALHALGHLNAIAWQQTAREHPSVMDRTQDRVDAAEVVPKPARMASLERCLTLPEQLDQVTQPLLPTPLSEVCCHCCSGCNQA